MKKNIITIIIIVTITYLGIYLYNEYRIKNAKILVKTIEKLDIEVYSDIKLKDLIKSINGKIISNKKINTTKIGPKKITFKYINDEKIKVSYSFIINIVDTTPPVINQSKNITIVENTNQNLEEKILCGDNYDNKPKCEIIGNYDINKIGSYNLTYKATDSSQNKTENEFILHVIPKNNIKQETNTTTYFNEVKEKNNENKVGIDVSHHQGKIDFEKVKNAGTQFVFIRVGTQTEKNGEYILDSKFKENIEGFIKVKIPIGIYFYSHADSKKEAKKEAIWVIKQIKKYKIDLPVVFDWENWANYKNYNLNFYHLTEIANTFTNTIEKNGYKSMIYSSKNYLEKIWMNPKSNIWLAHYTEKTDYKGKYKVWQTCDDGIIDGIDGKVDIDIMY